MTYWQNTNILIPNECNNNSSFSIFIKNIIQNTFNLIINVLKWRIYCRCEKFKDEFQTIKTNPLSFTDGF